YEQLLSRIAPEVNPYNAEQIQQETRSRNTMRGRIAKGKKPATGRASPEGRQGLGTGKIKTVAQEVRGLAEQKLADIIAKHPAHATVRQARGLLEERDALRNILNARAEYAFGGPSDRVAELERELEQLRQDPRFWDYSHGRADVSRWGAQESDRLRAELA